MNLSLTLNQNSVETGHETRPDVLIADEQAESDLMPNKPFLQRNHLYNSVTIEHSDKNNKVDLMPARSSRRMVNSTDSNRFVSYSPDGRAQFEVEYVPMDDFDEKGRRQVDRGDSTEGKVGR